MVAGLPEPARRWLTHAIAPGTPLWRSVELSMRGQIRLGQWRPFTARQVLAPPGGYIWAVSGPEPRPRTWRFGQDIETAEWWWGTQRQAEGEFFRAHVTAAVFR